MCCSGLWGWCLYLLGGASHKRAVGGTIVGRGGIGGGGRRRHGEEVVNCA